MDRFDLDRLAKVIGMVGSAHEGEALAALRKADAMLRAAGLTWLGLMGTLGEIRNLIAENERLEAEIERLKGQVTHLEKALFRPAVVDDDDDAHKGICRKILNAGHKGMPLSAWETQFLDSLLWRDGPLSAKQRDVLGRLRRRARI